MNRKPHGVPRIDADTIINAQAAREKADKALAIMQAEIEEKRQAALAARPTSKKSRENMTFGVNDERKGRPADYLRRKAAKSAESKKIRSAMQSAKGSKK